MNHSVLVVSSVVSQSPFTPGVVIIHNGNGTALEHNYMQQMSFVFSTGTGCCCRPVRVLRGEQASKKAIVGTGGKTRPLSALELGSEHSCNKPGSPENVCNPNSQSGGGGERGVAGTCQLPA